MKTTVAIVVLGNETFFFTLLMEQNLCLLGFVYIFTQHNYFSPFSTKPVLFTFRALYDEIRMALTQKRGREVIEHNLVSTQRLSNAWNVIEPITTYSRMGLLQATRNTNELMCARARME